MGGGRIGVTNPLLPLPLRWVDPESTSFELQLVCKFARKLFLVIGMPTTMEHGCITTDSEIPFPVEGYQIPNDIATTEKIAAVINRERLIQSKRGMHSGKAL